MTLVVMIVLLVVVPYGGGAAASVGHRAETPYCRYYSALVSPGPTRDELLSMSRAELAAYLRRQRRPIRQISEAAPEPLGSRAALLLDWQKAGDERLVAAWAEDNGRGLYEEASQAGFADVRSYVWRDDLVVRGKAVSFGAFSFQKRSFVNEVAVRCGKVEPLPVRAGADAPALPAPLLFDRDAKVVRVDPGDAKPRVVAGLDTVSLNSGLVVSPDGLLLAYQRPAESGAAGESVGSTYEWWIAGVDGAAPRRLTAPGPTACASWISNSDLAITDNIDGRPIRVVGLDGSSREIPSPPGIAAICADAWSGDSLVVTGRSGEGSEIWRVPLDGAKPERLVRWKRACGLGVIRAISTTSRVLVNSGCPDPASTGLYEVNTATGKAVRRITALVGPFDVTPGGAWVAFYHEHFDPKLDDVRVGIWAARRNGSAMRRVATGAGWPAWIP